MSGATRTNALGRRRASNPREAADDHRRLVYDRNRALAHFGFDYRLEIYVPQAKRRWGYYVLPVLRGERLIAKADVKAHRGESVLRVPALHMEAGATADDVDSTRAELLALARLAEAGQVGHQPTVRGR